MPFNFPASPTVGQESVQNGRNYKWTGSAWEIVTVYTDFSSNVNALLPVIANNADNRVLTGTGNTTGISAESNLTFDGSLLSVTGNVNVSGTINVSGVPLGEFIDDEVAGLLVAGSGISLNYNDSANTLTVDSNVSTSLVAGTGISLNYNISTDELSIGLSSPIFVSGNNFGIGTSSPSSALDINSDSLRIRTSRTPASAAASGNAGDICWDANYLYVCVATNTWKRSAITTW